MTNIFKQIIARLVQLADQIIKEADFTYLLKKECSDIKIKTENLRILLREAAASKNLYEQPTRRITDIAERVLNNTLQLVFKCQASGLRRLFTAIPPATDFRRSSQQIDKLLGDVTWLLRVCNPVDENLVNLGLPPFGAHEPIRCMVWEQIAILSYGTRNDQADAAAALVSLARYNDYRYGRMIIEEGGLWPLLKLAKQGTIEGHENAIQAIGLLCRDPESIEQAVISGVCTVVTNTTKEGYINVQVSFAEANNT